MTPLIFWPLDGCHNSEEATPSRLSLDRSYSKQCLDTDFCSETEQNAQIVDYVGAVYLPEPGSYDGNLTYEEAALVDEFILDPYQFYSDPLSYIQSGRAQFFTPSENLLEPAASPPELFAWIYDPMVGWMSRNFSPEEELDLVRAPEEWSIISDTDALNDKHRLYLSRLENSLNLKTQVLHLRFDHPSVVESLTQDTEQKLRYLAAILYHRFDLELSKKLENTSPPLSSHEINAIWTPIHHEMKREYNLDMKDHTLMEYAFLISCGANSDIESDVELWENFLTIRERVSQRQARLKERLEGQAEILRDDFKKTQMQSWADSGHHHIISTKALIL